MAYGVILGQTPSVESDFPVGGIILWSGSSSNIPENWHLCDGTSGTPDLRNRFVIGAGNNYGVGNGEILTDDELHYELKGHVTICPIHKRIRTISYDNRIFYHKMVNGEVVEFKELTV